MKSRLVKFLTRLVWAIVLGCLVGAFGGWLGARALHIPQLDQLPTYRPATTSHIFAADGSVSGTFALERRVELPPEAIPDSIKLSIVAIEDANWCAQLSVSERWKRWSLASLDIQEWRVGR